MNRTGAGAGRAFQGIFVVTACVVAAAQQLPAPPPVPAWVAVKPIDPPASPFPTEAASARVTKFSFVA
jgi:hypothetical protein